MSFLNLHKFKLKFLLKIVFIWFLVHTVFIIVDGFLPNNKNADVAVVLGNKVNEDGTLSERLKKRLECSLLLYQTKKVKKIIVSGGLGKEGFMEGDKMKEFLVKNKVPKQLIIVDNHGDNTLATVKNTLALQKTLNFKSIIVVSQYYHITRTKMLFNKNGFQNVSGICPNYFEIRDFYSVFREFFAFYADLI